ncbi:uncharacterized protein A4U43_C10F10170 [Asparagus officinalis]|uniref:Uncharacterized protein n=1 Tax=Asparagus officinalis TaxID=4686 RepID=A0A5P1E247_ASPOF|nr:uncharacterized protein A4U43_C10F10170 [Asparagus officinalis]
MKKALHDEVATISKIGEGHIATTLKPSSEVAPFIVPPLSATEAILLAPVVVMESDPSALEAMTLTLVAGQQVLTEPTTEVAQLIVSEGTMEAAITVFSREEEEEGELVDYFGGSDDTVDDVFRDYDEEATSVPLRAPITTLDEYEALLASAARM